jgi:hypothetical protein
MKKTLRWMLTAGLALASGLTGLGHAEATGSSQTSFSITIHVQNYARVAPKTLAEAEAEATAIFANAGIETRWADRVLTADSNQENSAAHPDFTLADIQVNIFPHVMYNPSSLPNNVMGLAPGNGPDRRIVYIFESNVEARYWKLLNARCSGQMDRRVSKAQILGHVMAHEVGHLLLNQQVHSAHGIMRGDWNIADFRDMTGGMLLFTPEQAESLRADVHRRNAQREIRDLAADESAESQR